jgi:hypothetical protein
MASAGFDLAKWKALWDANAADLARTNADPAHAWAPLRRSAELRRLMLLADLIAALADVQLPPFGGLPRPLLYRLHEAARHALGGLQFDGADETEDEGRRAA